MNIMSESVIIDRYPRNGMNGRIQRFVIHMIRKTCISCLVPVLVVILAFMGNPTMAASPGAIGGNEGWYSVHANVDGASVYFDSTYQGVINAGVLNVPVYSTGTPYKTYKVEMTGYTTYTDSMPGTPGKGETVDLYATLNPAPPTNSPVIGGDQGWYVVHANVDGASVYFDSSYQGVISSGELSVPVYTSGTPYKTYKVEMTGYTTYTGTLPGVPGKGETIDLFATLNPVAPTNPPVIGGDQGWYVVHANVDGASVYFDNQLEGQIVQGTLTVPVYTTGTPFKAYTVSMAGYSTFTGQITQYPSKGQTVDLYATLNPQPTTVPTTVPSTTSPIPVLAVLGSLVLAGACVAFFRNRS